MKNKYRFLLILAILFLYPGNKLLANPINNEDSISQLENKQVITVEKITNIVNKMVNFLSDKSRENIDLPDIENLDEINNQSVLFLDNSSDNNSNMNNQTEDDIQLRGASKQNQITIKYQGKFIGDRRSEIAVAVQEILNNTEQHQGIGEQVREITQRQINNHEILANNLARIENQNKFIRFIFGPEPQTISTARQILANNQQYIAELENLKNSLASSIDQEKISDALITIQTVEAELEDKINNSTKVFSLLGWLINLINNR